MQGLWRDSGSADILTYFGEWHKSEFSGYQPGNVLPEKAGEGYGPHGPPPPPSPHTHTHTRSSGDLHCQQKAMIRSITIEQYEYKSGSHKQYELFVLL